jgi:spermidine/putrescine transport system permease protein
MKTKHVVSLIFKWAILVIVLAAIYMPLALIVAYSFSSARNVGENFGNFTFSLYSNLFADEKLLTATINTLVIGLVSALLATVLGTTAAIGIHYLSSRKRKVVDAASQITVVNAEIVTAMGFFLLMLTLRDTLNLPFDFGMVWLIITHTVITTPYVILTVSPRLKQLNPNLLEASMDLGASPMRSLITVMIPQLFGSMISAFALAFTLSLDDFVVANANRVGRSEAIDTISTYVYEGIKLKLNTDIRALSTIIFVAVLVVLIVVNIVKGNKAKKNVSL